MDREMKTSRGEEEDVEIVGGRREDGMGMEAI